MESRCMWTLVHSVQKDNPIILIKWQQKCFETVSFLQGVLTRPIAIVANSSVPMRTDRFRPFGTVSRQSTPLTWVSIDFKISTTHQPFLFKNTFDHSQTKNKLPYEGFCNEKSTQQRFKQMRLMWNEGLVGKENERQDTVTGSERKCLRNPVVEIRLMGFPIPRFNRDKTNAAVSNWSGGLHQTLPAIPLFRLVVDFAISGP